MLHKDYLYKHKKVLFITLLTQGKLYQRCAETEKQAQQMLDFLVEKMKLAEGITEELKEENQFEWVVRMNDIRNQATEIVNNDIIYN